MGVKGISKTSVSDQLLDTYSLFVPPQCAVKVLKSMRVPWVELEDCIKKTSDLSPGCAACGIEVLRTAVKRCDPICTPLVESGTPMGTFKPKFHNCMQCIKPSFAQLDNCAFHKTNRASQLFDQIFG